MELNQSTYKLNETLFLQKNVNLRDEIRSDIQMMFENCKKRMDRFYMVEEALIFNLALEGNTTFYDVIFGLMLKPYDFKVKSLEILRSMDFSDFIKEGTTLDSKMYDHYTDVLTKEIYYRKYTGTRPLDVVETISAFEDYLFYNGIYRIANANAALYAAGYESYDSGYYIAEPLLYFGRSILKNTAERQIENFNQYEDIKKKQEQLIESFGRPVRPFNNYPKAMTNFYNVFSALDIIEIGRRDFLSRLTEIHHNETSQKIELDLSEQKLTTKEIGYFFNRAREIHCDLIYKEDFRIWLQKNFVIKKRDGDYFKLEDDRATADLISKYSIVDKDDKKLARIEKLMTD